MAALRRTGHVGGGPGPVFRRSRGDRRGAGRGSGPARRPQRRPDHRGPAAAAGGGSADARGGTAGCWASARGTRSPHRRSICSAGPRSTCCRAGRGRCMASPRRWSGARWHGRARGRWRVRSAGRSGGPSPPAGRAARSSRASACPYNRPRYAAGWRRGARRRPRARVRRRRWPGNAAASVRQHQARDRFTPSRCAIVPSDAVRYMRRRKQRRRKAGRDAASGRNASNQPAKVVAQYAAHQHRLDQGGATGNRHRPAPTPGTHAIARHTSRARVVSIDAASGLSCALCPVDARGSARRRC